MAVEGQRIDLRSMLTDPKAPVGVEVDGMLGGMGSKRGSLALTRIV